MENLLITDLIVIEKSLSAMLAQQIKWSKEPCGPEFMEYIISEIERTKNVLQKIKQQLA